jgi:hypothetical protein
MAHSLHKLYALEHKGIGERSGILWKDFIYTDLRCCLGARLRDKGHFRGLSSEEGHALAQLVTALRYNRQGRGHLYQWCHLEFLTSIIFPAALRS